MKKHKKRGFAAMKDKNEQRWIASLGGLTVSRNRKHMARIGRIGGLHSHGVYSRDHAAL